MSSPIKLTMSGAGVVTPAATPARAVVPGVTPPEDGPPVPIVPTLPPVPPPDTKPEN